MVSLGLQCMPTTDGLLRLAEANTRVGATGEAVQ